MIAVLAQMKLGPADLAVLAVYAVILGVTAWVLNRSGARASAKGTRSGSEEQEAYFLAGRSMPTWAVAVSMLATTQSAAALLGGPEQASTLDLRYLWTNLGVLVATGAVVLVFVPVYYRLKVATPYELIRRVYGPAAQKWTAVWYLAGRLLANGARLFLGSVPFCLLVVGEVTLGGVLVCIAGFSLFGALFTLKSGARGAIYSDVVQVGVYLTGMVVLTLVAASAVFDIDPGLLVIGEALEKATLFGPIGDNFDVSKQFTIVASIIGWSLLNLGFFAMDQDLTQRLLACRDAKTAARSMIVNTLALSIPVTLLFMLLGILIKARTFAVSGPPIEMPSENVLVWFAGEWSWKFPGLMGLLLAAVMAAGPAGINGSLNAMSSALLNDVLEAPKRNWTARRVRVISYVATAGFGVLMGACACLAAVAQERKVFAGILDLALGIMVPAFAGLVPVFVFAMWRVRGGGARAGAITAAGSLPAIIGLVSGSGTALWLMETSVSSPWRLLAGCVVGLGVCAVMTGIRRQ